MAKPKVSGLRGPLCSDRHGSPKARRSQGDPVGRPWRVLAARPHASASGAGAALTEI